MNNCPICKLSWLSQHPELMFWKKCDTCGYSEIDQDAISKYNNIDPLSPRNNIKLIPTYQKLKIPLKD